MAVTTVLFDLDGTLLPMDQEVFIQSYFTHLAKKLAPHGYDPKKLYSAIWAGTKAMVLNNGKTTNEKAFWEYFCSVFGKDAIKDEPVFDEYYRTDFNKVKEVCGYNENADKTVKRTYASQEGKYSAYLPYATAERISEAEENLKKQVEQYDTQSAFYLQVDDEGYLCLLTEIIVDLPLGDHEHKIFEERICGLQ